MAKIQYVVEGDAGSAVGAMVKLEERTDKVEQRLKSMTRSSQTTGQAMGQIKDAALGILSALGLGAGVAGVMTKIVGLAKQYLDYMDKTAERSRQAGQNMTALAMMQEGGQARRAVLEAARVAAGRGITDLGQAWFTVQAMQAKTKSYTGGLAAADAIFALQQLAGVPGEAARQAVSVGTGLHLTPMQAARAVYAAGKASQLSPAELASMAGQGLPPYMGVGGEAVTGYGVAAALSGVIQDPGLLGTSTRQVGTLLQQRTGAVGKLWGRLGFRQPGAQPMEQLQALQAAGITTMGGLQQAGFAKKESLGLAVLLADLPAALKTMEAVRGYYGQPGLISRDRFAAERELPQMGFQRQMDRLDATIEYERTFGPYAEGARTRALRQKRRALALERMGLGFAVGEDRSVSEWEWFWIQNLFFDPLFSSNARMRRYQQVLTQVEAEQTGSPGGHLRNAAANLDHAAKQMDAVSGVTRQVPAGE